MVKKVLKFGGTSVGTTKRIQHVAKIIEKEHSEGNKVIAVVSAMSGKTNKLIQLSNFLNFRAIGACGAHWGKQSAPNLPKNQHKKQQKSS